ncbi:MAG: response regulator [Gammaproteobacteria bacterium]|nr:response regulator [Gammaproteobacteria bacterium]MBU1723821.1 response regulator [Gammaproteobacteria bacterium]MBU2007014.1 response regulator [Gammaproteobacteria bacterium]
MQKIEHEGKESFPQTFEEVLLQSQEDCNRAQEVGQIGSWRLDVRQNVLTWSEQNHRIFGVAEGTPMSYEGFLQIVHPDDREYVDAQWQAGLRGEPYDIEHRIVVNGQLKWVREKAYLEFGPDGGLVGGFGITQDITGRKLAELALKDANLRKDEFLAMLAHELRNPLAPICNAVQILRMTGGQNPLLEQATGLIDRQVRQLTRLVDDLLDVSRVSRGKITMQKELLELASVIQQAVETSQPLIESRQHKLNVAMPMQTIRLAGDAARLGQVISNLLNNAAKYTDKGGAIELRTEQVVNQDGGHEAVIHISDNGRGIDPLSLTNLFNLFYQADPNLDRSDGGLGIGLSLVRNLVEMHGGRVEAYSAGRGQGATFTVHLPCLPEKQPVRDSGASCNLSKASTGLRILLVEDNMDVADSMAMLLRLLGHEVLLAHDGRQAVEMALAEKPRVILLDIGLPYLNGYEACRAIRQGGLTGTLIVALSGYGQEEDRRMAEEAGFNRHMSKPVDLEELEQMLDGLSAQ